MLVVKDSRNLFKYHNIITYNLHQINSKNKQKDIEEIAKGQKWPERAIPLETRLHTKINPNEAQKSPKILQKLSPKHAAHGVAQSP